ncbi:MAG: DUF58 domain-containing protein [Candidatus Omnitrophica bacterium]|nr:DUF58 domain-containing protein [Candidatus Omnitrophota bacterium]
MPRKNFHFSLKITSIFLSLTLIFSNSLSFAVPVKPASAVPSSLNEDFPGNLSSVRVPEDLGTIQESFRGNTDKVIVLIQDAHAVPDAQRNIQKLIAYFQTEYKVNLVGLEGAVSKLDPRIFKSFPDKEILKKTLDQYFERGELTGGTAAAILDESESVYQGIEDLALYEEGIRLYQEAMLDRDGAAKKIDRMKKVLNSEKEKIYSKKLLEIDRALEGFYENNGSFLEVLEKLAGVKRPAAGSELALILEESRRQGNDQDDYREVKRTAQEIKKHLPPSDIKMFHQKYQEFQTAQITPQAFALFLEELVGRHPEAGLRMTARLSRLVKNQKKLEAVRGTKLFDDFERYARSVEVSLIQTEEQKKLSEKSRQFRLLERLARLELSREDWNEIQPVILTEFRHHLAFYRNAEKRDHAIWQKFSSMLHEHNVKSAILVAGGFHGEGLTRRLKESQMSYLLLSPAIHVIPEKTAYRDQMKGEFSWKHYFKVEHGRISLYKAFVRATRDQLLKTASHGRTLKTWRDQIIMDLADEGKIEKAGEYTAFMDEVGRPSQNKIRDPGMQKIDRFLAGLRMLETKHELTTSNILKLFQTAPVSQGTIPTFAAGADDPGLLAKPQSLFRSEARVIKRIPERDADIKGLDIYPVYLTLRNELEAAGLQAGELKRVTTALERFISSQHPFTLRRGKPLLNLIRIFDPDLDGRISDFVLDSEGAYQMLGEAFNSRNFYDRDRLLELYFMRRLLEKQEEGQNRFEIKTGGIRIKSNQIGNAIPDAIVYDKTLDRDLIGEFRAVTGASGIKEIFHEKEDQLIQYIKFLLSTDTAEIYPQHVIGQRPVSGFLFVLGDKLLSGRGEEKWELEAEIRQKIKPLFRRARVQLAAQDIPILNSDLGPDDVFVEPVDQPVLYRRKASDKIMENEVALSRASWTKVDEILKRLMESPEFAKSAGPTSAEIFGYFGNQGGESPERMYDQYQALGPTRDARMEALRRLPQRSEARRKDKDSVTWLIRQMGQLEQEYVSILDSIDKEDVLFSGEKAIRKLKNKRLKQLERKYKKLITQINVYQKPLSSGSLTARVFKEYLESLENNHQNVRILLALYYDFNQSKNGIDFDELREILKRADVPEETAGKLTEINQKVTSLGQTLLNKESEIARLRDQVSYRASIPEDLKEELRKSEEERSRLTRELENHQEEFNRLLLGDIAELANAIRVFESNLYSEIFIKGGDPQKERIVNLEISKSLEGKGTSSSLVKVAASQLLGEMKAVGVLDTPDAGDMTKRLRKNPLAWNFLRQAIGEDSKLSKSWSRLRRKFIGIVSAVIFSVLSSPIGFYFWKWIAAFSKSQPKPAVVEIDKGRGEDESERFMDRRENEKLREPFAGSIGQTVRQVFASVRMPAKEREEERKKEEEEAEMKAAAARIETQKKIAEMEEKVDAIEQNIQKETRQELAGQLEEIKKRGTEKKEEEPKAELPKTWNQAASAKETKPSEKKSGLPTNPAAQEPTITKRTVTTIDNLNIDQPNNWVAETLDSDGDSGYLAVENYKLINPITGEYLPSEQNWVDWTLENRGATGAIIINSPGPEGFHVPMRPRFVIVGIETEKPSQAKLELDKNSWTWRLKGVPAGKVKLHIRKMKPGEMGEMPVMKIDEKVQKTWVSSLPEPLQRIIQKAKGLPLEERVEIKNEIMGLIYYTQNPLITTEGPREDFVKRFFAYFAGRCGDMTMANAALNSELGIPGFVQTGLLDHDGDRTFYSKHLHAWVLTSSGIDESTSYAKDRSNLHRRNVTMKDWEAEFEFIKERAKRIRAQLENLETAINLKRQRKDIQETAEREAADKKRKALQNKIKPDETLVDYYGRLKKGFEEKRNEFEALMASDERAAREFIENIRHLDDFNLRNFIGNPDEKENDPEVSQANLMAMGDFFFAALDHIERSHPNLKKQVREAKQKLYGEIYFFAVSRDWNLQEPLPDPERPFFSSDPTPNDYGHEAIGGGAYSYMDPFTGIHFQLYDNTTLGDYSQSRYTSRSRGANTKVERFEGISYRNPDTGEKKVVYVPFQFISKDTYQKIWNPHPITLNGEGLYVVEFENHTYGFMGNLAERAGIVGKTYTHIEKDMRGNPYIRFQPDGRWSAAVRDHEVSQQIGPMAAAGTKGFYDPAEDSMPDLAYVSRNRISANDPDGLENQVIIKVKGKTKEETVYDALHSVKLPQKFLEGREYIGFKNGEFYGPIAEKVGLGKSRYPPIEFHVRLLLNGVYIVRVFTQPEGRQNPYEEIFRSKWPQDYLGHIQGRYGSGGHPAAMLYIPEYRFDVWWDYIDELAEGDPDLGHPDLAVTMMEVMLKNMYFYREARYYSPLQTAHVLMKHPDLLLRAVPRLSPREQSWLVEFLLHSEAEYLIVDVLRIMKEIGHDKPLYPVDWRMVLQNYVLHLKRKHHLDPAILVPLYDFYIPPFLVAQADQETVQKLNSLIESQLDPKERENLEAFKKDMEQNRPYIEEVNQDYPQAQAQMIVRPPLNPAGLNDVVAWLRGKSGFSGRYFDVELSSQTSSRPVYRAIKILRSNSELFKFSKTSVQEKPKEENWQRINQDLRTLLRDHPLKDVVMLNDLWKDFWTEYKNDGLAILLTLILIYYLAAYFSNRLRAKDKIVGKSARKIMDSILRKNRWLRGRNAQAARELLELIMRPYGELPPGEIETLRAFRASLSAEEQAVFDILSSVAVEPPALGLFNIWERIILLPLFTDKKAQRQRQAMNRELLGIVSSFKHSPSLREVYRRLRTIYDKYSFPESSAGLSQIKAEIPEFEVQMDKVRRALHDTSSVFIEPTRQLSARPDGNASKRPGMGDEFLQHRDYTAGDDVRHIDWRVWARSDRYNVKERSAQKAKSMSMLVDLRSASNPSADEWAREFALSLAVADKKGRVYGEKGYSMHQLLFLMPDGRIEIEKIKRNRRQGFVDSVAQIFQRRYEEAKNIHLHERKNYGLSFYTPAENTRHAQRNEAVFESRIEIPEQITKLVGEGKIDFRRLFLVGIPSKEKNVFAGLFARHGVRSYEWKKNVAEPVMAASSRAGARSEARMDDKISKRLDAILEKTKSDDLDIRLEAVRSLGNAQIYKDQYGVIDANALEASLNTLYAIRDEDPDPSIRFVVWEIFDQWEKEGVINRTEQSEDTWVITPNSKIAAANVLPPQETSSRELPARRTIELSLDGHYVVHRGGVKWNQDKILMVPVPGDKEVNIRTYNKEYLLKENQQIKIKSKQDYRFWETLWAALIYLLRGQFRYFWEEMGSLANRGYLYQISLVRTPGSGLKIRLRNLDWAVAFEIENIQSLSEELHELPDESRLNRWLFKIRIWMVQRGIPLAYLRDFADAAILHIQRHPQRLAHYYEQMARMPPYGKEILEKLEREFLGKQIFNPLVLEWLSNHIHDFDENFVLQNLQEIDNRLKLLEALKKQNQLERSDIDRSMNSLNILREHTPRGQYPHLESRFLNLYQRLDILQMPVQIIDPSQSSRPQDPRSEARNDVKEFQAFFLERLPEQYQETRKEIETKGILSEGVYATLLGEIYDEMRGILDHSIVIPESKIDSDIIDYSSKSKQTEPEYSINLLRYRITNPFFVSLVGFFQNKLNFIFGLKIKWVNEDTTVIIEASEASGQGWYYRSYPGWANNAVSVAGDHTLQIVVGSVYPRKTLIDRLDKWVLKARQEEGFVGYYKVPVDIKDWHRKTPITIYWYGKSRETLPVASLVDLKHIVKSHLNTFVPTDTIPGYDRVDKGLFIAKTPSYEELSLFLRELRNDRTMHFESAGKTVFLGEIVSNELLGVFFRQSSLQIKASVGQMTAAKEMRSMIENIWKAFQMRSEARSAGPPADQGFLSAEQLDQLLQAKKGPQLSEDERQRLIAENQTKLGEIRKWVDDKKQEFGRAGKSMEETMDSEAALERMEEIYTSAAWLLENYPDLFERYDQFLQKLFLYEVLILNKILAIGGFLSFYSDEAFERYVRVEKMEVFDIYRQIHGKDPNEETEAWVLNYAGIHDRRTFVKEKFDLTLEHQPEWLSADEIYYLPGLPVVVGNYRSTSADHDSYEIRRKKIQEMAKLITSSGILSREPHLFRHARSVVVIESPDLGFEGAASPDGRTSLCCIDSNTALNDAAILIHEAKHTQIDFDPRWKNILRFEKNSDPPTFRHSWMPQGLKYEWPPSRLLAELAAHAFHSQFVLDVWDQGHLPFNALDDYEMMGDLLVASLIGAKSAFQLLDGHQNDMSEEGRVWLKELRVVWEALEPRIRNRFNQTLDVLLASDKNEYRKKGYEAAFFALHHDEEIHYRTYIDAMRKALIQDAQNVNNEVLQFLYSHEQMGEIIRLIARSITSSVLSEARMPAKTPSEVTVHRRDKNEKERDLTEHTRSEMRIHFDPKRTQRFNGGGDVLGGIAQWLSRGQSQTSKLMLRLIRTFQSPVFFRNGQSANITPISNNVTVAQTNTAFNQGYEIFPIRPPRTAAIRKAWNNVKAVFEIASSRLDVQNILIITVRIMQQLEARVNIAYYNIIYPKSLKYARHTFPRSEARTKTQDEDVDGDEPEGEAQPESRLSQGVISQLIRSNDTVKKLTIAMEQPLVRTMLTDRNRIFSRLENAYLEYKRNHTVPGDWAHGLINEALKRARTRLVITRSKDQKGEQAFLRGVYALTQSSRRLINRVVNRSRHSDYISEHGFKRFLAWVWDIERSGIDPEIRKAILLDHEVYFRTHEFGTNDRRSTRRFHGRLSDETVLSMMKNVERSLQEIERIARYVEDELPEMPGFRDPIRFEATLKRLNYEHLKTWRQGRGETEGKDELLEKWHEMTVGFFENLEQTSPQRGQMRVSYVARSLSHYKKVPVAVLLDIDDLDLRASFQSLTTLHDALEYLKKARDLVIKDVELVSKSAHGFKGSPFDSEDFSQPLYLRVTLEDMSPSRMVYRMGRQGFDSKKLKKSFDEFSELAKFYMEYSYRFENLPRPFQLRAWQLMQLESMARGTEAKVRLFNARQDLFDHPNPAFLKQAEAVIKQLIIDGQDVGSRAIRRMEFFYPNDEIFIQTRKARGETVPLKDPNKTAKDYFVRMMQRPDINKTVFTRGQIQKSGLPVSTVYLKRLLKLGYLEPDLQANVGASWWQYSYKVTDEGREFYSRSEARAGEVALDLHPVAVDYLGSTLRIPKTIHLKSKGQSPPYHLVVLKLDPSEEDTILKKLLKGGLGEMNLIYWVYDHEMTDFSGPAVITERDARGAVSLSFAKNGVLENWTVRGVHSTLMRDALEPWLQNYIGQDWTDQNSSFKSPMTADAIDYVSRHKTNSSHTPLADSQNYMSEILFWSNVGTSYRNDPQSPVLQLAQKLRAGKLTPARDRDIFNRAYTALTQPRSEMRTNSIFSKKNKDREIASRIEELNKLTGLFDFPLRWIGMMWLISGVAPWKLQNENERKQTLPLFMAQIFSNIRPLLDDSERKDPGMLLDIYLNGFMLTRKDIEKIPYGEKRLRELIQKTKSIMEIYDRYEQDPKAKRIVDLVSEILAWLGYRQIMDAAKDSQFPSDLLKSNVWVPAPPPHKIAEFLKTALKNPNSHYVLIDHDPAVVARAREMIRISGAKNMEFVLADILSADYPKEHFSQILWTNVRARAKLDRLLEWLKPHGTFEILIDGNSAQHFIALFNNLEPVIHDWIRRGLVDFSFDWAKSEEGHHHLGLRKLGRPNSQSSIEFNLGKWDQLVEEIRGRSETRMDAQNELSVDLSLAFYPEYLTDLLYVGPRKPVGYLSLNSIGPIQLKRQLIRWAQKHGLSVKIVKDTKKALYFYDKAALQKIINQNRAVLRGAGIPLRAGQFIAHIGSLSIRGEAKEVIDLAFANGSMKSDPRFKALGLGIDSPSDIYRDDEHAEMLRVLQEIKSARAAKWADWKQELSIDPLLAVRPNDLTDLLYVGSRKPMGYVPLNWVGPIKLQQQLIRWAKNHGLSTRIFGSQISRGQLYFYDQMALRKIIDQNQEILKKAGIPLEADQFVEYLYHQDVHDKKARKVIGLAFAESSWKSDPQFKALGLGVDRLPDIYRDDEHARILSKIRFESILNDLTGAAAISILEGDVLREQIKIKYDHEAKEVELVNVPGGSFNQFLTIPGIDLSDDPQAQMDFHLEFERRLNAELAARKASRQEDLPTQIRRLERYFQQSSQPAESDPPVQSLDEAIALLKNINTSDGLVGRKVAHMMSMARILKARSRALRSETRMEVESITTYPDFDTFLKKHRIRYLATNTTDELSNISFSMLEAMKVEAETQLHALEILIKLRADMDEQKMNVPLIIWQNLRLGEMYPFFSKGEDPLKDYLGIVELTDEEFEKIRSGDSVAVQQVKAAKFLLIKKRFSSIEPVLNPYSPPEKELEKAIRQFASNLRAPVLMVDHSTEPSSLAQRMVRQQTFQDEKIPDLPRMRITDETTRGFASRVEKFLHKGFIVTFNANLFYRTSRDEDRALETRSFFDNPERNDDLLAVVSIEGAQRSVYEWMRETVQKEVHKRFFEKDSRSEMRKTAKLAAQQVLGKNTLPERSLIPLAGSVEKSVTAVGARNFAKMMRSEARVQIAEEARVAPEQRIDTQKLARQKARAVAVIRWFEDVRRSLGDGSVAVAVHAPDEEHTLQSAFSHMGSDRDIVILPTSDTKFEMPGVKQISVGKDLSNLEARWWGNSIINQKFIPTVQIGNQRQDLKNNPDLLPVESINSDPEIFGPFQEIVDAVSRFTVSKVTGRGIDEIEDLNQPEKIKNLIEILLRVRPQLLREASSFQNMLQFNGINRILSVDQAILAIVAEELARAEVRKAA